MRLVAVAAVLGVVGLRTQKLRAESRRLERIVTERTKEIRERESEVRAQADELRRLDEIVKAINREEGLRNVLHALLEEGLKLVPQAEKGTFLVRDLKTDQFVFATHVGYEAEQLKGSRSPRRTSRSATPRAPSAWIAGCTSCGRRSATGRRAASAHSRCRRRCWR